MFVSKRELKSLLAHLLPQVHGEKQATALFTVALLVGVSIVETKEFRGTFENPHLHVETGSMEPLSLATVTVTNTSSGMIMQTFHVPFEHR